MSSFVPRDDFPPFHPRQSYNVKQVFDLDCVLPTIQVLRLYGVAGQALEFLQLIFTLPSLQGLYLGFIELVRGSWEGLIEAFRHCVNHVGMNHPGIFWHNGGQPFEADRFHGSIREGMSRAIEKYVRYGGRHPSLPEGAPDDASWHYYADLYSEENLWELYELRRSTGASIPARPKQLYK